MVRKVFVLLLGILFVYCPKILAQQLTEYPRVAGSGWPVIHQNDLGTKELEADGPVRPSVIDTVQSVPPILMLLDNQFLYVQETLTGKLKRYKKDNLAAGAVGEFNVGRPWPFSGGGVLDQFGNSWWTGENYLLRVSPDFKSSVVSVPFPEPGNGTSIWHKFYNSVNLLPDGRVLVSTMSPDMYLLDTQLNEKGNFSLNEVLAKTDFNYAGEPVFRPNDSYGPRPVTNDNVNFYLASSDALAKVHYNIYSHTFEREVLWSFQNPQNSRQKRSNMAVSNPVVVGSLVCVATEPLVSFEFQKVYCLNTRDGKLIWTFTPFSIPGISAAHTLGAIESQNRLFVIARSDDDSGGVAGFDLMTGKKLWPNVPLKQISESLVIASGNRSLYVSAINKTSSLFELIRIDTDTGQRKVIQSLPTSETTRASLGALDSDGSLYFATPGGISRYRD